MSRLSESIGRETGERSFTDRVTDALPARNDPTWLVVLLALALFVGFSIYTSLQHFRFATTGADLGAYTHMFSSTLNGEGWLDNGKYRVELLSSSYWGAHFSLTLLAFIPLFALVPSVYTLLVVKCFVLAASVVVLWVLARDRLGARLGGVVTLSYAFNPFLWSAWSFDFQEQILIPPLLFAAYYCYRKDRTVAFLVLFLLVLFTNEFVIFPAIGFTAGLAVAALLAGRAREKAPAIVGAVVALGVARFVSSTVIEHFSRASGLPVYVIAEPLQAYVQGATRVSILDLLGVVLTNPTVLIDSATFAVEDKLLFFAAFMLPVLFLALFDELSLFALGPYLGFAWIFTGASKAVYFEFGAHYPLYLLPFVYIGVIHLLARLSTRFGGVSIPSRAAFSGVATGVLVLCLVAGIASGGGHFSAPPPADEDHDAVLQTAIDSIPADATLLAQNDIYPHVATRPNATFIVSQPTFEAYEQRYGPVSPEYVLIDTNLNPDASWGRTVQRSFGERLGDEYGLLRYQDGVQVYQRGYEGRTYGVTQRDPSPRVYDASEFASESATEAGTEENATLVSEEGSSGDYIWFGPYDTLAPGNYTATFRVNVSGDGDDPVLLTQVAGGEDHAEIANTTVAPGDGWQNVSVPFRLTESTSELEYRGVRRGEGRVVLDRVEISYPETANTTEGGA